MVIVPCGINVNVSEEEKSNLMAACQDYEKTLSEAGIRVKGKPHENVYTEAIPYSWVIFRGLS